MKQTSVFFVIGHGFTTLSSLQNLLKALYAELYFVQVPLAKEADPADKKCFFHFDGIWLKFFIKFFRFFGILWPLYLFLSRFTFANVPFLGGTDVSSFGCLEEVSDLQCEPKLKG